MSTENSLQTMQTSNNAEGGCMIIATSGKLNSWLKAWCTYRDHMRICCLPGTCTQIACEDLATEG